MDGIRRRLPGGPTCSTGRSWRWWRGRSANPRRPVVRHGVVAECTLLSLAGYVLHQRVKACSTSMPPRPPSWPTCSSWSCRCSAGWCWSLRPHPLTALGVVRGRGRPGPAHGRRRHRVRRGEALTLGCAVAFAVHVVILSEVAERHDPVRFTWVQLLTVAEACLGPTAVTCGLDLSPRASPPPSPACSPPPSPSWPWCGKQVVSPAQAVATLLLEPMFGRSLGRATSTRQPPPWWAGAGGAAVVVAEVVPAALAERAAPPNGRTGPAWRGERGYLGQPAGLPMRDCSHADPRRDRPAGRWLRPGWSCGCSRSSGRGCRWCATRRPRPWRPSPATTPPTPRPGWGTGRWWPGGTPTTSSPRRPSGPTWRSPPWPRARPLPAPARRDGDGDGDRDERYDHRPARRPLPGRAAPPGGPYATPPRRGVRHRRPALRRSLRQVAAETVDDWAHGERVLQGLLASPDDVTRAGLAQAQVESALVAGGGLVGRGMPSPTGRRRRGSTTTRPATRGRSSWW